MAAGKIPDWVTAELFEDVLKSNVDGYSKVRNFKAEMGSAAGDNYATIMLRVNIEVELQDGTTKEVSYMVKLPHQMEIYKEMMKHTNIFEIERTMYNLVVPEMEALYKAAGVEVTFGAKSYELKNAQTEYIALEDLCIKGFKNANRLEGLDQAHTERVLRKLAQWHAATAVRVATKGQYPEIVLNGFFKEENRPMMNDMMNGMGQVFVKCCSTYEGNETYIEKVKALKDVMIDELFKMCVVDPTEFNVLNHGDSWSNNIMFQYEESGKIKEVYMVDFQVSKYGTVAQDLYYFLISSTKLEDKLSKFDYYVKVYHDNLLEHLKILKYSKPLPSLRDIHKSLYKYGTFAYSVATGVMAAVLVDPTESASFENFVGDSAEGADFQMKMYNNPRYRKHMQAILPWLLNRGALDFN
uniref:CHKov1 n=2 Tax=Drosophila melanogaster TaxID=7227 RepID=Q107C4_DROME|nr:CHKov1 [Drosophila melanogaster]AAZ78608.1 CHKov1 [Drosophila melanogaster]AAZ78622.1 CHKov1 [Drosophila melanogaster]AAZ78636.1 CHKov1 [Drosophila melanogaster]